MCGIGGVVGNVARNSLIQSLEAMKLSLVHRGPDSNGVFIDEGVGLMHTRLSIVDLSSAGHQPMIDASGRYALSYNGELYNAPILRQQLEALGHTFISRSDTEVVLNALVEWGLAALAKFNGMFALAFWDKDYRTLWLARDRFGIKPLYYTKNEAVMHFASEIKALIAAECLERKMSFQGFSEYMLYGAALGEETLYDSCQQLLPGHFLIVNDDGVQVNEPFWSLADVSAVRDTENEAVERIADLLSGAVASHMMSDVPVGIFLSGGLDSSTLCSLAAEHSPNVLSAYSVEFEGETAHSEIQLAKEVAQACGVSHDVLELGFGNLQNSLEQIVESYDQPFGDAAALPLMLLSQALSHEKVVLQGDGGDEIFAGYRRYQLLQQTHRWQFMYKFLPIPKALLNRSISAQRFHRMQCAMGNPDGALRNAWLLTEDTANDNTVHYLNAKARDAFGKTDPIRRYKELWQQTSQLAPAQSMLYTDARILLPDVFLQKVDRVTMRNSIEVRVPFLDNELSNYVMGLPARLKCGSPSKHLLRKAMRHRLPKSVLEGPKHGFGVPYSEWLRGPLLPLVRQHLQDPNGFLASIFDVNELTKLCDDHAAHKKNKGFFIYKLLMLSIWAERFDIEAPFH